LIHGPFQQVKKTGRRCERLKPRDSREKARGYSERRIDGNHDSATRGPHFYIAKNTSKGLGIAFQSPDRPLDDIGHIDRALSAFLSFGAWEKWPTSTYRK
jgi:hypothetical protein